jgi:hypothetical protein
MASMPAGKSSPRKDKALEERFERLAQTWEDAVGHHSSHAIRTNHPAYREIVALGPAVVPLLLRDLESKERHWFAALAIITGANPVPASKAGKIPEMIKCWLQWGKENGYQW